MASESESGHEERFQAGTSVHVPSLEGWKGRLRVDERTTPIGTIQVDDGELTLLAETSNPDAVYVTDDRADMRRIVEGKLNPIVAAVQGRLGLRGDLEFAIRVILALNAAKLSPDALRGVA
jgi:putative sterol carrier protein